MKLPHGTHLKPERSENFYRICRELALDFGGAMRLKGTVDGQLYFADLLIDEGKVIAASLKGDKLDFLGEDALAGIQEKLAGSSGKLDLYEFTPEEMSRSIETNEKALLEGELRIQDIGVRIKSRVLKPDKSGLKPGEDKPRLFGRIAEMVGNGGRKPRSGESVPGDAGSADVRPIAESPEKLEKPRPGLSSAGPSDDIKLARIHEIKEQRLKKLKKIIVEEGERPKKGITEGMKVETNIDRLYRLIGERKTIKINDALANTLRVSKTQIEEWAMILEEHSLVELHYPAIGEPEIRIVQKNA